MSFDKNFIEYVVNSLANDYISRCIKSDGMLLEFGMMQLKRSGSARTSEVRSELRMLGKVKLELRKASGLSNALLEEFLKPDCFDMCIRAVKSICRTSDQKRLNGTAMLVKPALALKFGQILNEIAIFKCGKALRRKDKERKDDANRFIDLYFCEWHEKIGIISRQTTKEQKLIKKEVIPHTEYLVKLNRHLKQSVFEKTDLLKRNKILPVWNKLAETLLARITVFNTKKGEEASQMLLSSAKQMKYSDPNSEIFNTSSKLEVHLAKMMQFVEVPSKQLNYVPVILTTDMAESLKVLIASRKECCVAVENPYVFAKGESDHMSGDVCLKKLAYECHLEKPELGRSTKICDYMATVAQVWDMSGNDLSELARHMDHELSVHRNVYRLQEDVMELSKISRLLLLTDQGKANQFRGTDIDDIQLDDLFEEKDDSDITEVVEADSTQLEEPISPGCSKRSLRTRRTKLYNTIDVAGSCRDDSVKDPNFNPDGNSDVQESDSDTDFEKVSKSLDIDKSNVTRTVWTNDELTAITQGMLPKLKMTLRPPRRMEIINLQTKFPVLKNRNWTQIKFRAWAMLQKHMKNAYKLKKLSMKNN